MVSWTSGKIKNFAKNYIQSGRLMQTNPTDHPWGWTVTVARPEAGMDRSRKSIPASRS